MFNRSDLPGENSRTRIVDPKKKLQKINKRIDEKMLESSLVENAKLMGFEVKLIRATLQK